MREHADPADLEGVALGASARRRSSIGLVAANEGGLTADGALETTDLERVASKLAAAFARVKDRPDVQSDWCERLRKPAAGVLTVTRSC